MRLMQMTVVSAVCAALAATAFSSPPVFTDLDYEEAMSSAKEESKLFLVDATAVWCGPCKQMDATTWVDQDVVSWIDENAVALQLDVDRDRPRAQELRIQAMPTIIVFRDGQEFDRVVGYQNSAQLLNWLGNVKEGKRSSDLLREQVDEDETNIDARYRLAESLTRTGKFEAAAKHYVWLWKHMLEHNPAMRGVRLSYMVSNMADLAERDDSAKKQFKELREDYASAIKSGEADRDEIIDWVHLNKVLGDDEATLAWYGRVREDPQHSRILEFFEQEVFELLVERERWAEAGDVLRDPVEQVRQQLASIEQAKAYMKTRGTGDPQQDEMVLQQMEKILREFTATVYVTLLAADRSEPAQQVAELLMEKDGKPAATALVEQALEVGEPRTAHLQWLAEDDTEEGQSLRQRVSEALQQTPSSQQ